MADARQDLPSTDRALACAPRAQAYAVAFDMDGTLVDLEALHHDAFLASVAAAGGLRLTWDQAFDRVPHFVGGPDTAVAVELAELCGGAVPASAILARKQECFRLLVQGLDAIAPRAGVRQVLDLLTDGGVPVAVGTVTEPELAISILDRAGLLPYFGKSRVVAATDVVQLKPAPDVYRETARRLGVPPRRQLVFEDSVTGVRAGRASGSRVLAVPTVRRPGFLAALRSAGAATVLSGWRDPRLVPELRRVLLPSMARRIIVGPGHRPARPAPPGSGHR